MPQQQPDRSSPVPGAASRRPDASMLLLTNIMEHSLDDGYAEAAARRGQVGASRLPKSLNGRLGLAAGLVLAALVVTLGAAQARHAAPTVAKERQDLINRIQTETASADSLQRQVDSLRSTVAAQQQAALKRPGGDADRLVELLAAATPVHGPGVKLVVNDAKEASEGGTGGPRESDGFSDTGRVRDRDMQHVVNGLWASGAEAISINGQRLTALSAIRAAGEAILVDNRPLVPPYTVLAIGDGEHLATAFRNSADGDYLHVLVTNYRIRSSLRVQGGLQLPAAPSLVLRYATPDTPDMSGTPAAPSKPSATPRAPTPSNSANSPTSPAPSNSASVSPLNGKG